MKNPTSLPACNAPATRRAVQIISVLLLTCAFAPWAQAADAVGDYRSKATGNYSAFATVWEKCTVAGSPGTFVAAIASPTSADTVITIKNGHTVTVDATVTLDQVVVESGGTLILSLNTCTFANGGGTDLDVFGTVTVSGNSRLALAASATCIVESGGFLQHNVANSIASIGAGGSITIASGGIYDVTVNISSTSLAIATCTWSTGSTLQFTGETSGTSAINAASLGQAFYNVKWNCPSQTGGLNFSGALTTVNGDLTVVNTGTSSWRLTGNTADTVAIAGNLNLQGGTLLLSTGSGAPTVNVAGDLSVTGGTLDMNNGGTLTSTVNVSGNVIASSGTIKKTTAAAVGLIVLKKAGIATFTGGATFGNTVGWTVNSGTTARMLSSAGPVGGTFTVNGSVDLNGQTVSLDGIAGSGTITNNGAAVTLTEGAGNTSSTFSGLINDGNGAITLAKNGTGTWTLTTANTYTGGTTLNAGVINLNTSSFGLGTGTLAVSAGANGQQLALGVTGLNVTNSITIAGGGATSQGIIYYNQTSGSATCSGPISITGAPNSGGHFASATGGELIISGAVTASVAVSSRIGTVTFSNSGSSASTLNINQGTVKLGVDNAIPTGATVDIGLSGAAILELNNFNQTLAGVTKNASGATIQNSGASLRTLTVSPAGTVTFAGVISGANLAVTKSGAGTLTLSGANTHAGDTTISTGTLKLGAANVIPDGSGKGNVSLSGTLDMATFSETINGLSGAGTVDNSAAGTPTLTIGGNNAGSSFSGLIKNTTGTLGITTTGSGTNIISGANNTYSGTTTIGTSQGASILRATATQALGSGTVLLDSAGNTSTARLELTNGISLNNAVTLSGRNNTTVGIENLGGNNTLSGTVSVQSGGSDYHIQSDADTLTIGTAAATGINSGASGTRTVTLQGAGSGTVVGNIVNGSATTLNLTKGDAGTWTLLGTGNTYTGDTTNSAGTLKLGASGVIPDGNGKGNVSVAGTLDLNTFSETINGLNGAGTVDSVAGGTPTLTCGGGGSNGVFSGVIQNTGGSLALTKSGSGVQTLAGVNTYTGNTTISTGTLALGGGGSISSTPTINVVSGAIFDVTAATFTLGASQTLKGNGLVTGAATINGTVAPGASIGTLTNSVAPTLGGTSVILAEINRASSPNADKLVINSGTLAFGGTLTVTNISGTLTNGDVFDLFDGALSGSFTTLNLPIGAAHWNTSDLNVGGTLTFTNTSPVAKDITAGVVLGGSVTVPVIGGKNSATDAEGDNLSVTAVSIPVSGTNSFGASNVTYIASGATGTNTFTYTVTDALGATDTKTVTVIVTDPQGFNQVFAGVDGGNAVLTYLGIPGTNYALDVTHDLPATNWVPVISNTASGIGYLYFTNLISLAPTNDYYRTRYVP